MKKLNTISSHMYVCVFNSDLALTKRQLKIESNCKLCENSKWQVHNSSILKGNLEKGVITAVEERTGGYLLTVIDTGCTTHLLLF